MRISSTQVRQETAGNPGALLKGLHTKSAFQVITLSSRKGMVGLEGTGVIQEEIELYGFGERAGGTATNVPLLSPSPRPPTEAIFPGLSTLLYTTSAWGAILAPSC